MKKQRNKVWKIAYADLCTALFVFFLMMWATHGGQGDGDDAESSDHVEESQSCQIGSDDAGSGDKDIGRDENLARSSHATLSDQEHLEEIKTAITKAVKSDPELSKISKSLIIAQTPIGLEIQVVDKALYPMFNIGSHTPSDRAIKLFGKISKVIHRTKHKISIVGHTDGHQYKSFNDDNLQLSNRRAMAVYKVISRDSHPHNININRIKSVEGRADHNPAISSNRFDSGNRRVSIILLKKKAKDKTQAKA